MFGFTRKYFLKVYNHLRKQIEENEQLSNYSAFYYKNVSIALAFDVGQKVKEFTPIHISKKQIETPAQPVLLLNSGINTTSESETDIKAKTRIFVLPFSQKWCQLRNKVLKSSPLATAQRGDAHECNSVNRAYTVTKYSISPISQSLWESRERANTKASNISDDQPINAHGTDMHFTST